MAGPKLIHILKRNTGSKTGSPPPGPGKGTNGKK